MSKLCLACKYTSTTAAFVTSYEGSVTFSIQSKFVSLTVARLHTGMIGKCIPLVAKMGRFHRVWNYSKIKWADSKSNFIGFIK